METMNHIGNFTVKHFEDKELQIKISLLLAPSKALFFLYLAKRFNILIGAYNQVGISVRFGILYIGHHFLH